MMLTKGHSLRNACLRGQIYIVYLIVCYGNNEYNANLLYIMPDIPNASTVF